MAMCTVDNVRIHANPSSISDAEITSIISGISTEILTYAGSTDETNAYLKQAAIHGAAAVTLKRARAKGELASSVKTPESEITIQGIAEEIKQHEELRASFLAKYNESVTADYSGISLHCGFTSFCGGH